MVGGDRVITYEMDPKKRRHSLHEFISREINPLLDKGWMVSDVKIKGTELDTAGPCRMEVILVSCEGAVQQQEMAL